MRNQRNSIQRATMIELQKPITIYLLSKITCPTGGYTTYTYDRYLYEDIYGDDGTCHDYYKYHVTSQKAHETAQVRHNAVTYLPFGGSNIEEGSEDYLFNGKEKSSSGLCYYGARYYDPDIGRFITRDQKWGRIKNPQVLNRYTYCINNPLKYIDPDGLDYFLPEWAHHEEPDSGLSCSPKDFIKWLTMVWKRFTTKLKANFYIWQQEHDDANYFLALGVGTSGSVVGGGTATAFGASTCAGIAAGAIFGIAAGVLFWLFSEDAGFYYELWYNDPEFVELFTVAEAYADLLMTGADCYQEASDAYIELIIYMLQQRHGDDWEKHCDPLLLVYYEEMLKSKEHAQSSSSADDQAGGDYIPPPGAELE